MQLSASTLPLDPTSLPAESINGAPCTPETEGLSAGDSDFGAVLSAQSGSAGPEVKTKGASANAPALLSSKAQIPRMSSERRETLGATCSKLSDGVLTSEEETIATPSREIQAPASVVEPPLLAIDSAPQPVDPTCLTVSWLTGVAHADTPPAEPTESLQGESDAATAEIGSSAPSAPQPFVGSAMTGKAQASLRAYGFRPTTQFASTTAPGAQGQGVAHAAAPALLHSRAAAFTSLRSATAATTDATVQGPEVPLPPSHVAVACEGTDPQGPSVSSEMDPLMDDQQVLTTPGAPLASTEAMPVAAPLSAESDGIEMTAAQKPESQGNVATVDLDPEPPVSLVTTPAIQQDGNVATLLNSEAVREKFADRVPRSVERSKIPHENSEISSLDIDQQVVASGRGRIGINAAKPETLMSASASTLPVAPTSVDASKLQAMPLSFDGLTRGAAEKLSGPIEQTANRAVESALAVAEQFVPGEQRSVRLQFNVGGEDLAVRVELRGEKVHTTFRAESPELCSALAREWQAVSSVQSSERTNRLAEPVFSSSSNGQSFSSDSGSTSQRDAGSRNPHAAPQEFVDLRRALRGQSNSAAPVSVIAPVLPSAVSTSGRLHTFA